MPLVSGELCLDTFLLHLNSFIDLNELLFKFRLVYAVFFFADLAGGSVKLCFSVAL